MSNEDWGVGRSSIFVKILFYIRHPGFGFPPSGGIQAVVRAARSGRRAASRRPDIALKARSFWPPAALKRARFMRWLTGALLADDAGACGPRPRGSRSACGACACGRTSHSRTAVAVFVVALSRRWRIADLADAARRAG